MHRKGLEGDMKYKAEEKEKTLKRMEVYHEAF